MTSPSTTAPAPAHPAATATERIDRLRAAAHRIRHNALQMGEVQGQGYIGQALGVADILAVAYTDQLEVPPRGPALGGPRPLPALHRPLRHRPVRRSPRPEPSPWRSSRPTARTSPGCRCRAWPPHTRGVSGGSLGHGLTVTTGMALGLRHLGNPARVFNLLSDGELDEAPPGRPPWPAPTTVSTT